MMKKLLVIVLAALIAIPSYSQIFKFGIKGGGQSNTCPTYNFTTGTNNITSVKDAGWGFHAGIFARIKILALYVQPEVYFGSNKFDYKVKEGVNPETIKSQTFNRVSIPLLVGVKFGPFRVNAGPAASLMVTKPEALLSDSNFENLYKSSLWGYQAGIGFDLLKKLTIDARYAGGLGDMLGSKVTLGTQTFNMDYSQTSFIISLGFMF
jgi:hypothetical protein